MSEYFTRESFPSSYPKTVSRPHPTAPNHLSNHKFDHKDNIGSILNQGTVIPSQYSIFTKQPPSTPAPPLWSGHAIHSLQHFTKPFHKATMKVWLHFDPRYKIFTLVEIAKAGDELYTRTKM